MSTNYTLFMFLSEYGKELWTRLDISSFPFDKSLNGFQIECPDKEIKKVAFAVDASAETIDRAADEGADVLVVHHGLFWGEPIAIKGAHYRRVKRAIDSGLSLFAAHLPLDAHPLYGNNAQMALRLGMTAFDPFASFHGVPIGFRGSLPFPMTIPEIARLLGFDRDGGMDVLKFGPDMIGTVAIVSGDGGDDIVEAIEDGVDLFITGVAPHEIYHTAKENAMNVLSGGHYRSEVFGVKALERLTRGEWKLDTLFIDAETGL